MFLNGDEIPGSSLLTGPLNLRAQSLVTGSSIDRGNTVASGSLVEHLTSYTLSPTDLIVGRSTWEWEVHKTKKHACVTRAGCVDTFSKNDRYTQLDDFSCNGIFANVVYTHSACDVRVRLGLVDLPFPSRASGDKIRGR